MIMEDKIKVYLSEEISDTLTRDAEFFEFYKNDRSVNRNDFLNTLIVNYFEIYYENDNQLHTQLTEMLDGEGDKADRILNMIKSYQYPETGERTDVTVSIKPTRRSAGTIDFIQNGCLHGSSFSGYFRNMFVSYCLLPQDKREEIIFRDKFEIISRAIKEGKMVYFTTSKSQEKHEVSPWAVSRSQEELFNYLICIYHDQPFSFRMTRIRNIHILNKPAQFSAEQKQLLEKMKAVPQFAFRRKEEICVSLTERGINTFNKIYSYRPKPIRTLKNLYYFDCSAEQIYHYFFRFGRQAKIIYPEYLKQQFQNSYRNAADNYDPQKGNR